MTNIVYIATSLDNYIASRNGGLDWLPDDPPPAETHWDDSNYSFVKLMDRIDAVVMGRHSFETVVGFGEWPYTKRVFALSSTLKTVPDELADRAEILSGSIETILAQLQDRGFVNLYIDGGKLIQSFLAEDLIDEMMITRVPILLGDGIPLFGQLPEPLNFELVTSEQLWDGMVISHYIRIRE